MVCGRTSVKNYLDAPVTHFVTLIDPGEKEPAQQPRLAKHRLQLVFSDLDDIEIHLPRFARYVAPEERDINELISFGHKLSDLDDWGLLANCEAGISRSTAAAITILTASGYDPDTAFSIVQNVCPEMLPNRRILRIADGLLSTKGLLHGLAESHRREMFKLAGYEDPTIVRLREAQAAEATLKGFLRRALAWIRFGKSLPDPRKATLPAPLSPERAKIAA